MDQVIQFWWQSGTRFRSGSPKSKIWILWIGGGLCSLSIDFLLVAAGAVQWLHGPKVVGADLHWSDILPASEAHGR